MLACGESNFPNFKFEYLRENEFLRKTILACLSGLIGLIYEKKLRSKISWHSPFNIYNVADSNLFIWKNYLIYKFETSIVVKII